MIVIRCANRFVLWQRHEEAPLQRRLVCLADQFEIDYVPGRDNGQEQAIAQMVNHSVQLGGAFTWLAEIAL